LLSANGVEDAIEALRGQLADAGHKIFGAIVDGSGAQGRYQFVLGSAGGAEHFELVDFPELQSCRTDSACCGVHE
jgi:hypothetical protein